MQERKLSAEEKWESATLANNFIFYKVMRHHQDACKRLIELLLDIKIDKIEMSNEESIEVDYDSKGIRLDVFVKGTDKIYDIELQVANTKELPERSRYYQGLMDLDTLKSGQKYKDLKDSHVIFICMEDIFDNALPVCTFENICIEDKTTKLNDRAYKHFFFAPTCAKMIKDKEVKSFFELLISNTAKTSFTSELKDYVSDAKYNMQWKVQFMTWERQRAYDFDDGKEAGIEIGAQQKAIEAAIMLVHDYNATPEVAAQKMNAPLELVLEKLKK